MAWKYRNKEDFFFFTEIIQVIASAFGFYIKLGFLDPHGALRTKLVCVKLTIQRKPAYSLYSVRGKADYIKMDVLCLQNALHWTRLPITNSHQSWKNVRRATYR